MKMKGITVENVLALSNVALALDSAPVTLVAGRNEAGKSSLQECVRMALGAEPARVSMKKDYGALVRDGAKSGRIVLDAEPGLLTYTLPDGKVEKLNLPAAQAAALPYVLEPARFMGAPEAERRTFLFHLSGVIFDAKSVREALLRRGAAEERVERVMPMLRAGFPAASKEAAALATEAKGAWRALTGEAYGAQKAERWRAPKLEVPEPGQFARAKALVAEREAEVAHLHKRIGAITQAVKGNAERERQRAELRESASRYAKASAEVNHNNKKLMELRPQISDLRAKCGGKAPGDECACPECGAALLYRDGKLSKAGGAVRHTEADMKLLNILEQRERDAERAMEVGLRVRDDANAAALALEKLGGDNDVPVGDVADLEGQMAAAQDLLRTARSQLDTLTIQERDALRAEALTEWARAQHLDVVGWSMIAEALSPEGIPAELLAAALGPINDRLRESAAATGWAQVVIGHDMAVTCGGRPYRLQSESARWRADVMLAEAISHLSGLKLLMADRVDVLDIPNRGALLMWLSGVAERGELDSALLTGTFKAPPAGLPATISAHWLEHGTLQGARMLAEAA